MGCGHGSRWTPNVQAFPALGSHSTTDDGRRERPVPDDSRDVSESETMKLPISTLEMGGGPLVSHGHEMGEPTRGMRPAGAGGSLPQKPLVDLSEVRGNATARSLSVDAAEFSPALGARTQETAGSVTQSSVAGTTALVDFAEISVPVVAAMKFSAVAEVHSSAVDLDDDTSVVRASEQRSDVSCVDRPMTEISVPEPLEHSVLDVDLDGRPIRLEVKIKKITMGGRNVNLCHPC